MNTKENITINTENTAFAVNTNSSTYALRSYDGDSRSNAIALTLNSTKFGNITCPGCIMWYKYTASATGWYIFTSSGPTDMVGYLYNSSGTAIDNDDDDGTGQNFKITAQLTKGQTYYLKVYVYGEGTGIYDVKVTNQIPAESVSLNRTTVTLEVGDTVQLSATVYPTYATTRSVYWDSGDYDIASVNSNGLVTAESVGRTEVCAFALDGSGKRACCDIIVNPRANVPVQDVTVAPSSLILYVGQGAFLSATVSPSNATNKTVNWKSSHSNLVTVDNSGCVYACSPTGNTNVTITATTDDGNYEAYCTISVKPTYEVSVEESVSKTVSAGGIVWFKFNTNEAGYYTIYTEGNVDTSGMLHDSYDQFISWNDNSGSLLNFKMVEYLSANTTYYVRVTGHTAGTFNFKVTKDVFAEYVTLDYESKDLFVGEKFTLEPTISPSYATNKTVTWRSEDTSVATVSSSGKVIAVGVGTTCICAIANDGSNKRACCQVNVTKQTVTIRRDDGFNKVVFGTGENAKTWYCIYQDMIYDNTYINKSPFKERSRENLWENFNSSNRTLREYSDAEIKLLYAIDPYGVANYVNSYTSIKYSELKDIVNEKDRVFRFLFNTEPKYFKQSYGGEWYETDDKSDINNVVSESESYFGMHYATNLLRSLINAIDFVSSVLCAIFINEKIDKFVENIGTLLKIGIFCYYEEYNGSFKEILSLAANLTSEPKNEEDQKLNKLIDPVFDVLSVFKSFNELAEGLVSKPKYYSDTIDYCINITNYDVILELSNGDTCKLTQIKQALLQ